MSPCLISYCHTRLLCLTRQFLISLLSSVYLQHAMALSSPPYVYAAGLSTNLKSLHLFICREAANCKHSCKCRNHSEASVLFTHRCILLAPTFQANCRHYPSIDGGLNHQAPPLFFLCQQSVHRYPWAQIRSCLF